MTIRIHRIVISIMTRYKQLLEGFPLYFKNTCFLRLIKPIHHCIHTHTRTYFRNKYLEVLPLIFQGRCICVTVVALQSNEA